MALAFLTLPQVPVEARLSTAGSLESGCVVVDPAFAAKLTTAHHRWLETELAADEQLTRDVPNVGEEALAQLGDAGLIRVGEQVTPFTIVIGKVAARGSAALSPEEKLLRAIFGESAGEFVDRSVRAPTGCFGQVAAVETTAQLARVQVEWARPLSVGDVLDLDGTLAVVSAIRPVSGGDLEWHGHEQTASVTKHALAHEVMHARSIGPYDLVTQLPTRGKDEFGGQVLEPAAVRQLASHAPWVLWEAWSLKADDVLRRVNSYEAIIRGENPVQPEPPATPEATQPAAPGGDLFGFFDRAANKPPEGIARLRLLLQIAGWKLAFDTSPVTPIAIDDDEVLQTSSGEVKTHDDLFSQKIFGPTRDYECECGLYKRMKHRGVVCEKCGVEVIQSKVRRERVGHFALPEAFEHPRNGRTVSVVPVLPPDLRPAGSALDERYRELLTRSTPAAFAALLDTVSLGIEEAWATLFARPLDFSGVAHLTVDSTLRASTCRVPRRMLTELFKPFAYGLLEQRGYVSTIKSAKKLVEADSPIVRQLIDELAARHPLLLIAGGQVVCRLATPWDEAAIAVDAPTHRQLARLEVQLHVPLSAQAICQCLELNDHAAARPSTSFGWLARTIGHPLLTALAQAARTGQADDLDDLVLRCALGHRPPPVGAQELEVWSQLVREREAEAVKRLQAEQAQQQAAEQPQALARSLDELELSISSFNAFQNANFKTVGDVCVRTEAELLKLKGFKRQNLKEIKELLAEMGLTLGMRT